MNLTGKQKRTLRAAGHHLKPAVMIGKQGLIESVLEQVEAQLLAHELVKIKVLKSCPVDLSTVVQGVTERSGAWVAQSIGRTLLLYRPHPESPVIRLPA